MSTDNSVNTEFEKYRGKLYEMLTEEEKAFHNALISIAEQYGPFDLGTSSIWVGYETSEDNEDAEIGVKCSNCSFFNPENNGCAILSYKVDPNGKCRLAAIPDGMVTPDMEEEEEREEDEDEEGESEGDTGARVGADARVQRAGGALMFGQAATVRGAAPQITRADDPIDPTAGGIPLEVLEEEFDEDGPWAILSPNGTVLATSEAVTSEFPITAAAAEASGVADVRTVLIGAAEYRLMTLPVRHPDAGVDGPLLGYVQVAGRLDISNAQQESLLTTLLIFGGLGLAAALLVSVLVTRRVLAPIAAAATRERGMVAKASHELRTPASVILSSAEILEREGLVKPAGRDLLRGIAEESQRLGRLSADLLTLVKDRAGDAEQQLALTPGDVAEVARTAAERAKIMTAGSERTIETEITDRTLSAAIDADRLLQLLLNLVENAIRHSPPGGTITIGAAAHDGRAELWVDDEGLGIPEEERELVFDPFYRSPRDRSSRDGGSGLGLAIARSIVVAHGGSLTAESSASGGARLVARIPLIRAE